MTTVTNNPGINRALALVKSPPAAVALASLAVGVGLVIAHVAVTGTPIDPSRAMVPLVWIPVAVWFVLYLRRRGLSTTRSWVPASAGVVYFLVLAGLGGLVSFGSESAALAIEAAPPGWGPVVLASVPPVQVALIPFEAVGYVALAYGVYGSVAAASKGAVAGLVGLFACVSCTLPLVGAAVGAVTGAGLAYHPGSLSYDLSTIVFVLTIVLLAVAVPTER